MANSQVHGAGTAAASEYLRADRPPDNHSALVVNQSDVGAEHAAPARYSNGKQADLTEQALE